MRKYRVNVNGTDYEIKIELINETEVVKKEVSNKAEVSAAPKSQPVSAPSSSAGGENVTSPMPGTILSVNVKAGDTVKKGQVLMILEALKMENEIMAGKDGKVVSVDVSTGDAVESGALLCTIQ